MTVSHTVVQGDTLSKIAAEYGFADWETVYNYADNADFRVQRPNPNLIFPGDQVAIPEKGEPKKISVSANKAHTFVLRRPQQLLKLRVHDPEGAPLEGWIYKLTIADKSFEGTFSGLIEHPVGVNQDEASLEIKENEEEGSRCLSWTLSIGHLDPIETVSGYQARLNNLSYDCGAVDGVDGPKTQSAIKAYQAANELSVDGIAGPNTRANLEDVYGC